MKPYRDVFLNPELENQITSEGFVVIPMLKEEEVYKILSYYNQKKPTFSKGFHTTHFIQDRVYKESVHSFLKSILSNYLKDLLDRYSIWFCNFMVKEPGIESVMPLHTDWTYVDESKHRSFALWFALTDTSKSNGALGVIPRSHLLPFNIRGPKIKTPFHDYNELIIRNSGILLEIPAGHAVIYDHRLMHYSPPNMSSQSRVAVNAIILPEEAEVKHYCILDNADVIHRYKVNDERFFIEYAAFEAPGGIISEDKMPNPHARFSEDDLLEFLQKKAEKKNKSWFINLLHSPLRQFFGFPAKV